MFLAGAACWGVYSVLARIASRRFDAVSTTLYGTALGTVILIPRGAARGRRRPPARARRPGARRDRLLAVFGTVAAFVLLNLGVARIGATRASAFALLVPIVGVLTSVALLGERLGPMTLIGGAVVLAGLWLVEQAGHRRRAHVTPRAAEKPPPDRATQSEAELPDRSVRRVGARRRVMTLAPRPMRARELGIRIGRLEPGPLNAITDVAGRPRRPHHAHQRRGAAASGQGPVRTGVTVIVPHDGDIWTEPVFAGAHRLNGNGELTGLEWIREAGMLAGAIGITNTHSVGVVHDALDRGGQRATQPPARRSGRCRWLARPTTAG